MNENELINLAINNSFAIAVAAYLLIRLEKQINNLSSSINKLNTIISAKLGFAIDNDDSNKVAWEKAITTWSAQEHSKVVIAFYNWFTHW